MDDLGRDEVWQDFIDTRIPLGVPGNGMEIAYMCAFLASDMGAWITGQDLAVDGAPAGAEAARSSSRGRRAGRATGNCRPVAPPIRGPARPRCGRSPSRS